MSNRIEAQAKAKGLRLTGQRKLIAEVIARASDHPDVYELHRRVSECDDKAALATVYRTVRRFGELGIVERHEFQDGRSRYEPSPRRHHDHLIDVDTGGVVELRSEEIERLQAEIATHLGYELVGHRLELYARRIPAHAPQSNSEHSEQTAKAASLGAAHDAG